MIDDVERELTNIAAPNRRRTQQLPVAVALLAMTAAAPAHAQVAGQAAKTPEYNFELTPIAGFRFGGEFEEVDSDATVELDDHGSFGLILNGKDTTQTQWEVYYSQQSTSADTAEVPGLAADTDLDMHYLHLGGTYQGDGTTMRPYISAGIGGTYIKPDASGLDSDTFWSFSIGTGLQFFTTERWGLRLEARGIGSLVDSDSRIFCESDSDGATCAFLLDGDVLWQVEAFAGLTFRF